MSVMQHPCEESENASVVDNPSTGPASFTLNALKMTLFACPFWFAVHIL